MPENSEIREKDEGYPPIITKEKVSELVGKTGKIDSKERVRQVFRKATKLIADELVAKKDRNLVSRVFRHVQLAGELSDKMMEANGQNLDELISFYNATLPLFHEMHAGKTQISHPLEPETTAISEYKKYLTNLHRVTRFLRLMKLQKIHPSQLEEFDVDYLKEIAEKKTIPLKFFEKFGEHHPEAIRWLAISAIGDIIGDNETTKRFWEEQQAVAIHAPGPLMARESERMERDKQIREATNFFKGLPFKPSDMFKKEGKGNLPFL